MLPTGRIKSRKNDISVVGNLVGLSQETRLQIMLDDQGLQAIDDWQFVQRMPRTAAGAQANSASLQKTGAKSTTEPDDLPGECVLGQNSPLERANPAGTPRPAQGL
jgi:hypothetical protein